jgi:NAD(P)-dependent dehydrogenase (short-subunit alcohol dehydrogenase family)
MSTRLQGHRALVLGGGSGIGLASARALLAAGAQVTIAGRTLARLEAAGKASEHRLAIAQLDGSDAAAVEAFFTAGEPFHHLVLCANAGGTIGRLEELDIAAMRSYFDNKLWVYLHALKFGGSRMVPGGSITLVNGAASQLAVANMAALAVVNGGLDAIIRPLALEYAPTRVNAVSPGVIDTPYWDRLPAERRAQLYESAARGVPAGRIGTDSDVADAVLFFAGNSFVTGTVLLVDGGRHLTPNIA